MMILKHIKSPLATISRWVLWCIGITLFQVLVQALQLFIKVYLNTAVGKDVFSILPLISGALTVLAIIVVVILVSTRAREYIAKYRDVVEVLLILMTVIFTLGIYYTDQLSFFQKTDTMLIEADRINLQTADGLARDEKGEWIYWSSFLTSPYEQNLSFIGRDFARTCSDKYLSLTWNMQIANELNKNITSNFVLMVSQNQDEANIKTAAFKNNKQKLTQDAQQIKQIILEILKECHNL